MRRITTLALATMVALALAASPALADDDEGGPLPSITQIVVDASGGAGAIGEYDSNPYDYDVLRELVLALGLDQALSGGTWTVFAPNDKAFEKLGTALNGGVAVDEADVITTVLGAGFTLADVENIVLYHAIAGEAKGRYPIFVKKFWRTKTFEMANGDDLRVRRFRLIDGTGNRIRPVWKATNIEASNGYIHTIREVLLPPSL